MKVRFSSWWIAFFLLSLFSHQLQTYLIIFLMLLAHEFGHIVCAHKLGYEVQSMVIYPFGCGASIENIDYGNVWEELLIVASGISLHLIYPLILRIFFDFDLISTVYYDYLLMMNRSIMIFNLLPIFPLDGGRLLDCFFQTFFVYGKARALTLITSFFILICVYLSGYISGFSGLLVVAFLIGQMFIMVRESRYDRLAFYWYRYTHPINKRVKVHKQLDLYRQRTSVLIVEHELLEEKQWLQRKFKATNY